MRGEPRTKLYRELVWPSPCRTYLARRRACPVELAAHIRCALIRRHNGLIHARVNSKYFGYAEFVFFMSPPAIYVR